jgi:uncharacterized SAM-binding protein YcdF (DUF218 family)
VTRRPSGGHRLALLVALPALLALAWAGGFVWFLHAAWITVEPPAAADGIVALTGGAERVATALKLLAEGRARVLLVSGVGGSTEFAALAHRAGVDPGLGGQVTLGRAAASTHGNATETAEWAHANGLHSLIVVTAGYHMPRALAELSRALPEVALYPVPVLPPAMRQPGLTALRLLAGEYTKWLAAEGGLSALGSRGETQHPPSREDRPLHEERIGG